jgi:hypothetical protein
MRKAHSVRIVLDEATDHALHKEALRQNRPVANLCYHLIRESLAAKAQAHAVEPERYVEK